MQTIDPGAFTLESLRATQTRHGLVDAGIAVDEERPEYLRIPQQEHAELPWKGRVYRYPDRWAAIALELKPDFLRRKFRSLTS
ncbi:hypothetical protein SBV1_3090005 [Verrucomicrobia bacterium]|nr:hypothetical protein SBV1_3090005 [Verrucomicrobiota bacterium]